MKRLNVLGFITLSLLTFSNMASAIDVYVNDALGGKYISIENENVKKVSTGRIEINLREATQHLLDSNGLTKDVVEALPAVIMDNIFTQKENAIQLAAEIIIATSICLNKANARGDYLMCNGKDAQSLRVLLNSAYDRSRLVGTLPGTDVLRILSATNFGKFDVGAVYLSNFSAAGGVKFFNELGIKNITCSGGSVLASSKCKILISADN